MDADSGKVIDALDTEGGVDEVEWEPKAVVSTTRARRNSLKSFKQVDADQYRSLGKAETGALAKTSLLVPK